MKMREYVDGIQGAGAWDRMHDMIERRELFGWEIPPVEIDGRKVNIFPGEDREATLEAVQDEVRKIMLAARSPLKLDSN
jgi:hypothetical protein